MFSITASGIERTLYSFSRYQGGGSSPLGGVTLWKGLLYGTTVSGGDPGYGTAFKSTKDGRVSTIYNFGGGGRARTGWYPEAPLIAVGGALYGSDDYGGGPGTAFELALGRSVTGKALYHFNGRSYGGKPVAAMAYVNGKLYGTLPEGGANDDGVAFSLSP